MRVQCVWTSGALLFTITALSMAVGQTPEASPIPSLDANAWQVTHLVKLDSDLWQLAALRAQRSSYLGPSMEELTIRQQILETVQVCTLQVDGVIAEIAKEQSEISAVRTVLQDRRDREVNHLTTAALVIGSGLGVGASATQFTGLSNTTQNVGVASQSGVAPQVYFSPFLLLVRKAVRREQ